MAPRRKNDSADTLVSNPGLYITGTIANRTRRYISTRNNPNTEVVTYTITDEHEHRYFVDDFAPSSYYDISSPVTLPVYVKPYLKKNGDASYILCVQKNYLPITKGETF
jgi:hypothetical protein